MQSILLEAAGNSEANFAHQMMGILMWIFVFVSAVMVPFCIYMAFKFATASNEERRRSAKTRFINALASMLIIMILAGIMAVQQVMVGVPPGGTITPPDWSTPPPLSRPTRPDGSEDTGPANQLQGVQLFFPIRHEGHTESRGVGNGHNGVDLQNPNFPLRDGQTEGALGQRIFAIYGGEVVRSVYQGSTYDNTGYGNLIIIKHKHEGRDVQEFFSVYAHLSHRYVVSGTVTAGQVIGRMGNTGNTMSSAADAPVINGTKRSRGHLHFEMRTGATAPNYTNGTVRDPWVFVGGRWSTMWVDRLDNLGGGGGGGTPTPWAVHGNLPGCDYCRGYWLGVDARFFRENRHFNHSPRHPLINIKGHG